MSRKILNDPIYGFIDVPDGTLFNIIEHESFQRLRRILQLGLTYMVYPGAFHARFQHAIGATHLMDSAINILRQKGNEISDEEEFAVKTAILLHDIGHGPFSHVLEHDIVEGISHENISSMTMEKLNREFNNELGLAIEIFNNRYKKKFLHQLVSSQLDLDRLDYLKRDSFFTGVSEGVIGYDRIIKMFQVVNDKLVVEAKGIYSVEKFLVARRLMYWQVYLHKTVISAEQLLVKILKRAKEVAKKDENLFSTPSLKVFLYNRVKLDDFNRGKEIEGMNVLDHFLQLDDNDILASIKAWCNHSDFVLSTLCKSLINRKLFRTEIQKEPFDDKQIKQRIDDYQFTRKLTEEEVSYFIFSGTLMNNMYSVKNDNIGILYKNGSLVDISEASDVLNMDVLDNTITKYFLCYPKGELEI
jgi:HD superfamily phosphohydrolase